MSVEGNLDLFQLPEILQLIAQQQKTGILTVQGTEDIVAISFLHGKIVVADSLNQAVEEGLKQVLVDTGVLSAADFARAASEQATTGQRLIDFLVERRFVSRARLLEALRVHTRQLLETLLDWREGDFKFYSGDEVSYEEGFVPIRVDELLLHAVSAKAAPPAPPRRAPAPSPAPPPGPPSGPPSMSMDAPSLAPMVPPDGARPGGSGAVLGFPPAARAAEARSSEMLPAIVVPFPGTEPAHGPAGPLGKVGGVGIRQMTLDPTPVSRPARHLGRILAVLATLGIVALTFFRPGQVVLPFSWQSASLQGLDETQRSAQFLKIDRAAQTFYLLEGRFPEHLRELRDRGLLGSQDLVDVDGRPLRFIAHEKTYQLHAEGRSEGEEEVQRSISGNFLLDPEFLAVRPGSRVAPLVLLD